MKIFSFTVIFFLFTSFHTTNSNAKTLRLFKGCNAMKLKNKISDIIQKSGFMLSLTVLSVLLFSTLMLLLGFSVKPLFFPASLLIAAYFYFFLLRRHDTHDNIYGFILAISLLILFIFICGNVFDLSFDGNWYHKASIGSMAHGWNPVYMSLEDFAALPGGVNIGNLADSAIWADHYCKAPWIFGAGIYSLTGNIECAKAINPIIAYILFSVLYSYLCKRGLGIAESLSLSLLTTLNPVTVPQLFTFYTDGLLACSLFTIIVLLTGFCDKDYSGDKKLNAVFLFSALVFCINIKFTGLAYAGLFCLAFYILRLFIAKREKQLLSVAKETTVFFALAVICAVIFVGSSSYVKNTIEHSHPLYPLFGENSTDIMTANQPSAFSDMSGPQRLYHSLFSETSNLMGEGEIVIKEPFSVNMREIEMATSAPDIRLGGMGPLFSGIFILSLAVLAFALVYLAIRNRLWFSILLCGIIPSVLLLVIVSESWWARYSPYLWLFPVTALIFILVTVKSKSSYVKFPSLLLALFTGISLAVNTGLFFGYPIKAAIKSGDIDKQLSHLSYISENTPVDIMFQNYAFYGIEYNFRDYHINYRIVAELSEVGTEIYSGMGMYCAGEESK